MSIIETYDTQEAVVQSARLVLARYLEQFPLERDALSAMYSQLEEEGLGTLVRSTMRGHLTTSALVVDPAVEKVLLIHHKAYNQWLPPGGHYEFLKAASSLWESAEREVFEETAARAFLHAWCASKGIPLDIDTHPIPANASKNEGPHFHHDLTYLAVASSETWVKPQEEEVNDAVWVPYAEYLAYCNTERTIRMWQKFGELRKNGFKI